MLKTYMNYYTYKSCTFQYKVQNKYNVLIFQVQSKNLLLIEFFKECIAIYIFDLYLVWRMQLMITKG